MAGGHAKRWHEYYGKIDDRPPRETVLFALARFEAEGRRGKDCFAVDLGCGSGRDAIVMLRKAWRVLAIDAEPAAIEAITSRPDLPAGARLEIRVARFEEATWPEADLVNSSFALPLCAPAAFHPMWRRIVASLPPGGRFSGQLFGERDEWAGDPTNTHLTRIEAEALLDGLEVEIFREEETDTVTPRGTEKHWHLFHIVARRP